MSLALRIALSALSRPRMSAFGDDPSQRGDLHLPRSKEAAPVVVLLHGGHWKARFGKLVCRPLAADLAQRGWAVWNLEYRRLGAGRGGGGGWPMTFLDVARGIDHLATLEDGRLDLSRVVVVGHSAGAQLALWAGRRAALPAGAVGSDPHVGIAAVVGLSPVTNLARAGTSAVALMGGRPDEVPDRWEQADPVRAGSPTVPTLLVHPAADRTIAAASSIAYGEHSRRAGRDVEVTTPQGEGHRDPIDPSSTSWAVTVRWLTRLWPMHRP